jgi:hypothetical protein
MSFQYAVSILQGLITAWNKSNNIFLRMRDFRAYRVNRFKKSDFNVPVTGELASDRIGFGTATQNKQIPSSCQVTI